MSQQLAKKQHFQLRWHFTQKATQQSTTWDHRLWRELPDGSWLQESQPAEDLRHHQPSSWRPLLKRWQRHLQQLAVTDFQLNYSLERVFLYQPRPRALDPKREWTFSWTLPSRGLGPLLGSMCFRQDIPPSDFVQRYISLLTLVPVLDAAPLPDEPIFFDGRLLLNFLSHAVHHLANTSADIGHWEHQPKENGPLSPDDEPYLSENEPSPNLPNPLLPRQAIFYPRDQIASPATAWKALHYNNDEDLLVCYQHKDGVLVFKKFLLPDPLYRLFPQFRFLKQQQNLVIRKCQTRIPDAVWCVKAC